MPTGVAKIHCSILLRLLNFHNLHFMGFRWLALFIDSSWVNYDTSFIY